MFYDVNTTGVYKEFEINQKARIILAGHSPTELLFLKHSFLKSHKDNTLIITCVYHGCSSSFHVAKVLKNKLHKASTLYGHMKIEVSGTALIKKLVFRTENTCNLGLRIPVINFMYESDNDLISLAFLTTLNKNEEII